MIHKLSLLSAITALGLVLAVGPTMAQTAGVPEDNDTGATSAAAPTGAGEGATNEGSFEALSPGGQKITRALFDAQKQPESSGGNASDTSATTDGGGTGTAETTTPRSLDDIAAAKSGAGWGRVFKEMKAEGLIAEKNLGQVVSGANHRNRLGTTDDSNDTGTDTSTDTNAGTEAGPAAPGTTAAAASAVTAARPVSPSGHRSKPVTVTLANGATVVVGGSNRGRGHAPRGDAAADATATNAGTHRGHGDGSGTAGGHGSKHGIVAGAAGRNFGALLGNGAAAGTPDRGAIAVGAGTSHGGGKGGSVGHGSKGRGN